MRYGMRWNSPQPHLLAVGTPGVVIAVEGDPDIGLGMSEQTQNGLGAGGAVDAIRFLADV